MLLNIRSVCCMQRQTLTRGKASPLCGSRFNQYSAHREDWKKYEISFKLKKQGAMKHMSGGRFSRPRASGLNHLKLTQALARSSCGAVSKWQNPALAEFLSVSRPPKHTVPQDSGTLGALTTRKLCRLVECSSALALE